MRDSAARSFRHCADSMGPTGFHSRSFPTNLMELPEAMTGGSGPIYPAPLHSYRKQRRRTAKAASTSASTGCSIRYRGLLRADAWATTCSIMPSARFMANRIRKQQGCDRVSLPPMVDGGAFCVPVVTGWDADAVAACYPAGYPSSPSAAKQTESGEAHAQKRQHSRFRDDRSHLQRVDSDVVRVDVGIGHEVTESIAPADGTADTAHCSRKLGPRRRVTVRIQR